MAICVLRRCSSGEFTNRSMLEEGHLSGYEVVTGKEGSSKKSQEDCMDGDLHVLMNGRMLRYAV